MDAERSTAREKERQKLKDKLREGSSEEEKLKVLNEFNNNMQDLEASLAREKDEQEAILRERLRARKEAKKQQQLEQQAQEAAKLTKTHDLEIEKQQIAGSLDQNDVVNLSEALEQRAREMEELRARLKEEQKAEVSRLKQEYDAKLKLLEEDARKKAELAAMAQERQAQGTAALHAVDVDPEAKAKLMAELDDQMHSLEQKLKGERDSQAQVSRHRLLCMMLSLCSPTSSLSCRLCKMRSRQKGKRKRRKENEKNKKRWSESLTRREGLSPFDFFVCVRLTYLFFIRVEEEMSRKREQMEREASSKRLVAKLIKSGGAAAAEQDAAALIPRPQTANRPSTPPLAVLAAKMDRAGVEKVLGRFREESLQVRKSSCRILLTLAQLLVDLDAKP